LSESEIKTKEIIEEDSNSKDLACKLKDDRYALQKVENLFKMFRRLNISRSKQLSKDSRTFNGIQLTPILRNWISTINLKYKAIFYFCSSNLETDRKQ